MLLALEISVGYDSLRGGQMMHPRTVLRTRRRVLFVRTARVTHFISLFQLYSVRTGKADLNCSLSQGH
jgi:hypothetical protein